MPRALYCATSPAWLEIRALVRAIAAAVMAASPVVGTPSGLAAPVHMPEQAGGSCPVFLTRYGSPNAICAGSAAVPNLIRRLPFAAVDPRSTASSRTHLGLVLANVSSLGGGKSQTGQPLPLGPPIGIQFFFGRFPFPEPSGGFLPQSSPSFVQVNEFQQRETGGLHMNFYAGLWLLTDDLSRQDVALQVESDGPRDVVRSIGLSLIHMATRLAPKPVPSIRLLVTGPDGPARANRPLTFWVMNNLQTVPLARPEAARFDFTLRGTWGRPTVVTPDGSQACGGDNVPRQPWLRRGRWTLDFGDCDTIGLVLVPRGPGTHGVAVQSYRLGLDRSGMPTGRGLLVPGGGYAWQGRIRP